MFMRSERLFLRPGWDEDWQEIFTQIADEAVARNLAQVPWPYTAVDARAYAGRVQDGRHPHFLITVPGGQGAELIGCIGIKPGEDCGELGYWIGQQHWGRGFATEAARAVMSLARTLGHRQLRARHFADNPASGRVLRKLGFAPTGAVSESFSPARGAMAPSVVLAADLGDASDCDASDCDAGDNCMPAKRAA